MFVICINKLALKIMKKKTNDCCQPNSNPEKFLSCFIWKWLSQVASGGNIGSYVAYDIESDMET